MIGLVVLILVFVGARLLGLVLQMRLARRGAGSGRDRADPCLGPVLAIPPESPRSPEDTLFAQLKSGLISRSQYRAGMARLARLDDRSHPVELPPAT